MQHLGWHMVQLTSHPLRLHHDLICVHVIMISLVMPLIMLQICWIALLLHPETSMFLVLSPAFVTCKSENDGGCGWVQAWQ